MTVRTRIIVFTVLLIWFFIVSWVGSLFADWAIWVLGGGFMVLVLTITTWRLEKK